jgi:hypothetical protein
MKCVTSMAALGLTATMIFTGGCATSEHRMNVAASRDDTRRSEFEHCRAEGRSDCDAILNAPVNSNTPPRGDSVREQERRDAYDRCVQRGGNDCDDLLHH